MPEPTTEQIIVKDSKKKQYIIIAILIIILLLVLFGKNFIQIDTRWFIILTILGGTYIIVQSYWKRHIKENLHQMLRRIKQKEYEERGIILNTDADNVDAKPMGENVTYIFFKDIYRGYFYDHIINNAVGTLPRDTLSMEKTLREDQLMNKILSGEIKPQTTGDETI